MKHTSKGYLPAIVISDLHLSQSTPELTHRFFQLLSQLPGHCEQLYILGDLVEFWPGDDVEDDFSIALIEQLKQLTQADVALYIQHGNRDFLFGNQFAHQTGASLLPEYHIVEIGNHRLLMMHGDLLCTDDTEYLKFRKWVRSRLARFIWFQLPASRRHKIIAYVRNKNKQRSANKPENIVDVSPQAVLDTLLKHQIMTLIHGHTHRPKVHQLQLPETPAKRIVLGDWQQHYWWLEISNDNLHLKQAPIADEFKLTTPAHTS